MMKIIKPPFNLKATTAFFKSETELIFVYHFPRNPEKKFLPLIHVLLEEMEFKILEALEGICEKIEGLDV